MLEIMVPLGIVGLLLTSASGLAQYADRKLSSRPYRCHRRRVKEAVERHAAAARVPAPVEEPAAEPLPLLPSAGVYRNRAHAALAEKALREADDRARRAEARAAELRELKARKLDRAELLRVAHVIEHAVDEGRLEAEIARFPVELTSDNARAINNAEPFADTLRGYVAELHHYFARRPGYRLRAFVASFRNDGTPEKVALILRWA